MAVPRALPSDRDHDLDGPSTSSHEGEFAVAGLSIRRHPEIDLVDRD